MMRLIKKHQAVLPAEIRVLYETMDPSERSHELRMLRNIIGIFILVIAVLGTVSISSAIATVEVHRQNNHTLLLFAGAALVLSVYGLISMIPRTRDYILIRDAIVGIHEAQQEVGD